MGKITLVFGKKKFEKITGSFKEKGEISSCPQGKKVQLYFGDNENFIGMFQGIDGEESIMLKSLYSGRTIGLPLGSLTGFFQEE